MARPQEFDTAAAIQAAMSAFWKRGYESTSIDTLVRAMRINRSSLYNAFGDKENVFTQALDCYDDAVVTTLLAEMEGGKEGLAAIQRYFRVIANYHATEEGRKGCLMTNSATSSACNIRAVRSRLRSHLRRLERAFLKALERARSLGEIPDNAPVSELAQFLTTFVQGMQVIARISPERKFLDAVVSRAIESVRAEK